MIETLRAGDRVLSRDEHDTVAPVVEEEITEALARVARSWSFGSRHLYLRPRRQLFD